MLNPAIPLYHVLSSNAPALFFQSEADMSQIDPNWIRSIVVSGSDRQCCRLATRDCYAGLFCVVCDNAGIIQWHWRHGQGWWYPSTRPYLPLAARLSKFSYHSRLFFKTILFTLNQHAKTCSPELNIHVSKN